MYLICDVKSCFAQFYLVSRTCISPHPPPAPFFFPTLVNTKCLMAYNNFWALSLVKLKRLNEQGCPTAERLISCWEEQTVGFDSAVISFIHQGWGEGRGSHFSLKAKRMRMLLLLQCWVAQKKTLHVFSPCPDVEKVVVSCVWLSDSDTILYISHHCFQVSQGICVWLLGVRNKVQYAWFRKLINYCHYNLYHC